MYFNSWSIILILTSFATDTYGCSTRAFSVKGNTNVDFSVIDGVPTSTNSEIERKIAQLLKQKADAVISPTIINRISKFSITLSNEDEKIGVEAKFDITFTSACTFTTGQQAVERIKQELKKEIRKLSVVDFKSGAVTSATVAPPKSTSSVKTMSSTLMSTIPPLKKETLKTERATDKTTAGVKALTPDRKKNIATKLYKMVDANPLISSKDKDLLGGGIPPVDAWTISLKFANLQYVVVVVAIDCQYVSNDDGSKAFAKLKTAVEEAIVDKSSPYALVDADYYPL